MVKEPVIIGIDGPVGSGKSTIAKLVARDLDYLYVDTGAMYRCVALKVKRENVPFKRDELEKLFKEISINFQNMDDIQQVFLNGENVTDLIREPELSLLASEVSRNRVIRHELVRLQREIVVGHDGAVLEGRDVGTVIFPNAQLKVYLIADEKVRAQRRFLELQQKGKDVVFEQVLKDLISRDKADMGREHAPLKKADDACLLDSTNLTIPEVVNQIVNLIKTQGLA